MTSKDTEHKLVVYAKGKVPANLSNWVIFTGKSLNFPNAYKDRRISVLTKKTYQ